MKRYLLTTLVSLQFLFVIRVSCQINPVIPGWVKAEDVQTIGNVNPQEIKNGFYFVLVSEQYNTIAKQNFFHFAKKVVSEAGLSGVSQVEFSFDPSYQKAAFHYIRIRRGNSLIDKTKTDELKVLEEENERYNGLLHGRRTLYMNLSDVRKGDIVEYAFTVTGYNEIYKGHFGADFSLGYSEPVGRLQYRIVTDANETLSIKNHNTDIQPQITESALGKEYLWRVDNPPMLDEEDGIPAWYNPYAQVQVSNYKNWTEVKSWFNSLFNFNTYNPTALNEITDSIRKKHSALETQITACIDFVQDHIRYSGNETGIYSHQPHSPLLVLRNRFGDCKDKSLLLVELLKRFDVTAYPVIVNTWLKKTIREFNPSHHKFDHCITAVKYKGNLVYIDPTATFQGGVFPNRASPNYELAVVLDGSETFFSEMSHDKESRIDCKEEFEIEDNGDATLRATYKYYGSQADEMRYYIASSSSGDLQNNFKAMYKNYSGEIEVIDSLKVEDNDQANTITSVEFYRLKKFWTSENDSDKAISKSFLPYTVNDKITYVTEKKRRMPLYIPYPVNVHQVITIYKSGGFNVEIKKIERNTKFFDYSWKQSIEGNVLTLDYTYRSKTGHITPEDYKHYKSETDFIDNNIVFSSQQLLITDRVRSFNWLLLTVILLSVAFSLILCFRLHKKEFNFHYEERYNSIDGWLIVFVIGLIFTPFGLLYQLLKLYRTEFEFDYFYFFFNPDSAFYDPMKGAFQVSVCMLNVLLFAFSIYILINFFQRKNSFRVYYPAFRILHLALLVYDMGINHLYSENLQDAETAKEVLTQKTSILWLFIKCAIWIPYIWYSERSRHTFVIGNKPANQVNANETALQNVSPDISKPDLPESTESQP